MSMYNTKEIADLLDINEETVRRWVRSGLLKAERSSKKQGNIIHEVDLFEFFSLNDLLNDLIIQRNLLDEYIIKLQSLINLRD